MTKADAARRKQLIIQTAQEIIQAQDKAPIQYIVDVLNANPHDTRFHSEDVRRALREAPGFRQLPEYSLIRVVRPNYINNRNGAAERTIRVKMWVYEPKN